MDYTLPQTFFHGNYPSGTGLRITAMGKIGSRAKRMIVMTSPAMIPHIASGLSDAGLNVLAIGPGSSVSAKQSLMDAFKDALFGVLVCSMHFNVGWNQQADALVFVECHVNPDGDQHRQAIGRAIGLKEIHYNNVGLPVQGAARWLESLDWVRTRVIPTGIFPHQEEAFFLYPGGIPIGAPPSAFGKTVLGSDSTSADSTS